MHPGRQNIWREIGRLIDGFNTMLSEIQQRDTALQTLMVSETRRKSWKKVFQRKQARKSLQGKNTPPKRNHAKSTFLANMVHSCGRR